MSALPWKYFTSHGHGVDQNILSASKKETTTFSNQAKRCRRWKKKKIKDSTTELSFDQKGGKKRKSDELLENKMGSVDHGDVLESVSEQSNHVQFKRPRLTPHTLMSEAESALPFTDRWEVDSGFSSETSPPTSGRSSPCVGIDHSRLVALDCEMVGTGLGGRCSEVARCSIVNYYGSVIYDKYILPRHPVTDYRTRWSGIRKHHLAHAVPFEDAQNEIASILKEKIIVGHALFNDFLVLDISVPPRMIRDTSSCSLLRKLYNSAEKCKISLKKLAQTLLNRTIQTGRMGHCSVEDSRAAMDLYKLVGDEWEKSILSWVSNTDRNSNPNSSLKHYMEDQYWPESSMVEDQNQTESSMVEDEYWTESLMVEDEY
ncbi:apoptosis-enhancing nuclease isoform X2 [Pimephales promelas]|nr:apoptosis-enhancing nuclease isoform X2 [Pimephales promelas]